MRLIESLPLIIALAVIFALAVTLGYMGLFWATLVAPPVYWLVRAGVYSEWAAVHLWRRFL